MRVALYKRALERAATGEHHWNPRGRDAAANAIPYLIATAIREGVINLDSFDDPHLNDVQTRALMQKIEVAEDVEFTRTYPHDHRTRIVVATGDGRQVQGESGGGDDDLSSRKTQAQIADKFRSLTEAHFGRQRADETLERIWDIENVADVSVIASGFAP